MSILGILFSNLWDSSSLRLTATRTVAAIPFACRYRLIDFGLSALVNDGVDDVNIVSNYNFHSLSEHVGSGKDWDLARHNGGVTFISPYRNVGGSDAKMFNNHLEALLSMRQDINESRADTVILADCGCVYNPDLSAILRRHKEQNARMTLLCRDCEPGYHTESDRILVGRTEQGKTELVLGNRYDPRHPQASMNVYIIEMNYLREILMDAAAHNYHSLSRDILMREHYQRNINIIRYDDVFYSIDSFEDYYRYSMRLLGHPEEKEALLECGDRRVLTNVHNSAPVTYARGAHVKDSLLADGCVIRGTVENSVLFRNVHIGEGAVVKNCVLLNDTYVAPGAVLNCVVADTDVFVGEDRTISGAQTLPVYIEKGRRV